MYEESFVEGSVAGDVAGRRWTHSENLGRNKEGKTLVLSTVGSMSFLAPCRIVTAELWTHA